MLVDKLTLFLLPYRYNDTVSSIESRIFTTYEGDKFSIEWYFGIEGNSQPLDCFNKLLRLFKRMGDKLPKNIKERTLRLREEYLDRVGKGEYYEK